MKIALLGANGQLGSEFRSFFQELRDSRFELFAYTRANMDLTDKESIRQTLDNLKPDVVINAAAFTDVDSAESDLSDNLKVNYEAVTTLVNILSKTSARLIHFSTDYVFSSSTLKYFKINDEVCPINKYGEAKSKAEKYLREVLPESSTIIRTAWLYGKSKKNFVNKIHLKAKSHEEISVVNDQFGQPTWTKDLVSATFEIIQKEMKHGIYHVTGNNVISRFQLACQIYELSGSDSSKITEISSDDLETIASRPKYSCLDLSFWKNIDSWKPADWRDSLAKHLQLNT